MGLFDSVYVECPHCGSDVEFQTRVGDPYCKNFTLDSADAEQLFDIMNEPQHCKKCDGWLALIDEMHPPGPRRKPDLKAVKLRTPANARTQPQGYKWWPDGEAFSYADIVEAPAGGSKAEPR